MQPHLVHALSQALAAARIDEVDAVGRLLAVVAEAAGAREARLLLLQGSSVEIWRRTVDGDISLAVALDGGDDGFGDWRRSIDDEGSHLVLATALPLAPGVDAGLLAVDVPRMDEAVEVASTQLDQLALHAASVAAVSRADLERRIAVSAATNDDKLVKARQQATMLQRRAQWATNALTRVEADPSFTEDAAAHVAALAELVDDLVADLETHRAS